MKNVLTVIVMPDLIRGRNDSLVICK